MKTLLVFLSLLIARLACAHVGSPNVFFEGQAGPYPVRVVIRPPAVLPGVAQVDVRVDGATNVTLQAALWEAGTQTAPAPVTAVLVAGEVNLFNTAALWLFYNGSYSVHVRVEGPGGNGVAIVPLTSAALRPPEMSSALATGLLALGAILFAWAVWFIGMAARDGGLERGAVPGNHKRIRARGIAAGAAVIFATGVYAGKNRWQKMDAEFRNNALSKPVPVSATVRTNGNLRLLQIAPAADRTRNTSWETLMADHGKLMHLFLLREPEFNAFAHLHPVRRDAQTFENVLPPLPAGDYRLYAEVTHENGLSETLIARVTLPGAVESAPIMPGSSNRFSDVICQSPLSISSNSPQPFALDMDDSWHIGNSPTPALLAQESRLMSGLKMTFHNAGKLIENRDTSLRFSVEDADGRPVSLQPYMGMSGHAIVRRSGGEVFTHLHPVGTISMAAQQIFTRRAEGGISGPVEGNPNTALREGKNEVAFPYAFPRAGEYRMWVQIRVNTRVLTGVFDVSVQRAR